MTDTALVAVDWGTSNLRAYRMAADGRVLDRASSDVGALRVRDGAFEETLRAAAGAWMAPGVPVLLSGMVGSRQGWVEVPYRPCPAGIDDLAAATHRWTLADGTPIAIVPGVCAGGSAGATPDVMRGEEVQIVGVGADGLYALPGTHSKWATVAAGAIIAFDTHMTGEMFEVLSTHSILGRSIVPDAPFDGEAFDRGVTRAAEPGGLLHHAFGVRTLGLFDRLDGAAQASYLSGLLIGHELAAALGAGTAAGPVRLVGSDRLCALYVRALALHGWSAERTDPDAAAHGLHRLATRIFASR